MKIKHTLLISLSLNVLFIILFLSLTFIYRDKLFQGYVSHKGNVKIVMFGNSITAQGKWVELLKRTDVLNSGLPGQFTYHFFQLLQSHVIELKPEICFVKGGINDITAGVSQERIRENYTLILETIVKNNIIPVVTLTLYEQNDLVSKAEVDLLNLFLIDYCIKNKIEYIDLNHFLSDSSGLKSEYAVDKTHLNEKAYRIWAREIEKVLKKHHI